jgi:predicted HTH transcriptional regulator
MKTIYKIDLLKTEGKGDFPCPVCDNIISPDDMKGRNYKVLEIKSEKGSPEVTLQCNKCQNIISLSGLYTLEEKVEEEPIKVKPTKRKTDKQILELLKDFPRLTLNEIANTLNKNPKKVFKALRKLFNNNKISTDPTTRSYMLND